MTPVLPHALQHPVEHALMLDVYKHRAPMRTLEVGVGDGGTLYHWIDQAPRGATIVAIDDHHRNAGEYEKWQRPGVDFQDIWGSSHDANVIAQAASFAPYEWVFIDADHHAQAVRDDWTAYMPMCARDGYVVLHDVGPTDDPTIQVWEFWCELETAYHTLAFMEPGGFGIGVVCMPDADPMFGGQDT